MDETVRVPARPKQMPACVKPGPPSPLTLSPVTRFTRPLGEPKADRLPADHPHRARILAAHGAAVAAGEPGYVDPVTGYFVFTAADLAARGTCCDTGCRHCPYP